MLTVPVGNVTEIVLLIDTVPETKAVPEKPALTATMGAVDDAAGIPVVVYRNPTSETATVPEIETVPVGSVTGTVLEIDTVPLVAGCAEIETVPVRTVTVPLTAGSDEMLTVPVASVTGT